MINTRANFTRQQVAAICAQYGSQVGPLPPGVDGAQLLWALSGVESSFGADCQPRHEPAFDVGGMYATHYPMPGLLRCWGSAAACSYGPWQLMLCNAPSSCPPSGFDVLDTAAFATVGFLNSKLRQWKPQTLAQIGDCWNAGHITPDPAYEGKLAYTYGTSMPVVMQ